VCLQAKRLEIRSHLSELYQKQKHNYKKKSMTIEDIKENKARTILSWSVTPAGSSC
jgi:hypothetical protein